MLSDWRGVAVGGLAGALIAASIHKLFDCTTSNSAAQTASAAPVEPQPPQPEEEKAEAALTPQELTEFHKRSRSRARKSHASQADGKSRVRIVCTPKLSEYMRTIDATIRAQDSVLEVGCQRGAVTNLLTAKAESVVGLDLDRKSLSDKHDSAMKKLFGKDQNTKPAENLTFVCGNVWDMGADWHAQHSFNVVCIDLSHLCGNDLLFETFALARSLVTFHRATLRFIIIKSRRMSEHADQFENAFNFVQRHASEPAPRPVSGTISVKVVCAMGVAEYRKTIPVVVMPGDSSLEIGCHFGTTTKMIKDAAGPDGLVVGVDIGKECIETAQKDNPKNILFHVADGWNTAHLTQLTPAPQSIYLDIGGLSGFDGALDAIALITQLCYAFKPSLRFIVIKSRCMRDHANEWIHCKEILYKGGRATTEDHGVLV